MIKKTLVLLLGAVLVAVLSSQMSSAAVTGFSPGRIIDDAVFTNTSVMTPQDIQSFLNSKVPTCDTWGTQKYSSTQTRAQYAASIGKYPPFTCLKDYSENGLPAAQIIYNIAQQYRINPQVLLVLLQKEQSLVTDSWPYASQYQKATGYGCPDTAPCNTLYYGFTNQLTRASNMFRKILDNSPDWYTPYEVGNNYIQYNPSTACGGSVVNIENRATQALYNYTPYQPNQGALDAGWGTAPCGAYGNRNFYLYFTNWFGSTRTINGSIILSKGLTTSSTNGDLYQSETLMASYEVSNTASYDVAVGGLGICGRLNGKWYDFGYRDQTIIPANGKIAVTYSKIVDMEAGELKLSICSYHASIGGWAGNLYPWDATGTQIRNATIQVIANPVIIESPIISPTTPLAGEPVTISTKIKNGSSQPVTISVLAFAVRDSSNKNYDFPNQAIVIPANSTSTITRTRTFDKADSYSYFLSSFDQGVWNRNYPPKQSSSVVREGTFRIGDNPILSSSLSLSESSPAQGHAVTATFTATNNAAYPVNIGNVVVAARDSSGGNVDFPTDADVIIAANSTYTYSMTRTFSKSGDHYAFIANLKDGQWTNRPISQNSALKKTVSYIVRPTPVVSGSLTISPAQQLVDQPVTATFTLLNESDSPVSVGDLLVAARDPYGNNVDFPGRSNVIIAANSTYTYRETQTIKTTGQFTAFIANYKDGVWDMNYPSSKDNSIIRRVNFTAGKNPLVTSSLTVSGTMVGQPTIATISIRNNGDAPANIGLFIIAARDPYGNNVDFSSELETIIPPHSTLTYTKSRTFTTPGSYTFFTANLSGGLWRRDTPFSSNQSIVRSTQLTLH